MRPSTLPQAARLAAFIQRSNELQRSKGRTACSALFLTGAGVSTSSGIPDYRSPDGLYVKGHKPMTGSEFLSGEKARRRYYARSCIGFYAMQQAACNPCHVALAALVRRGVAQSILTQNVDGLHMTAFTDRTSNGGRCCPLEALKNMPDGGTASAAELVAGCHATEGEGFQFHSRTDYLDEVLQLHGNINTIRCLDCGEVTTRGRLQHRMIAENEALLKEHGLYEIASAADPESTTAKLAADAAWSMFETTRMRPDGDFDANHHFIENFELVPCESCGFRMLKPNVVFFGENVDPPVVENAFSRVERASCLICVGTSLEVYSAFRFVVRAKELGLPIMIVNRGPTRGDKHATMKIGDSCVNELIPQAASLLLSSV